MTTELATITKAAPPMPGTNGSVQSSPKYDQFAHAPNWVMQIASVADILTPWGQSVRLRDAELRAFWPTEPILASAVYTVCVRNAMQTVELDGPPRTVRAVQDMFDGCEDGNGLEALSTKVSIDLYTQDNAAFIELVGREKPSDPVISLNHLDAAQCRRTGRVEEPVVWNDPLTGEIHRLKWFQVIVLSEMPSPIRTMFGVQYCALTRLFRAAQFIRDVGLIDAEKAAGRFTRTVHLVGGVQTSTIEDKLRLHEETADNRGLARYINHLIIGSLDPTAEVSVAQIDLASAPKDFDLETAMKWYINNLAMAFGEDYQTFAPLPGGNLGSSQQSKLLDQKSKGKGPKAFTKLMIKAFRQLAVVPKSVTFGYEERDAQAEQDNANVSSTRATTRATRISSGEITVQVARNIAQDDGDLDPEYMLLLEVADANTDLTISDEEDAAAINEDVTDAVDGRGPTTVSASVQVASATQANQQAASAVRQAKDAAISDALDELRESREMLVILAAAERKESPMPSVNLTLPERIELQQPPQEIIVNVPPAVINVPAPQVTVMVPEQKELDPLALSQPIADALNRLADAMLAQKAPQVTVDAPVTVLVPTESTEIMEVKRDSDGLIEEVVKRVTRRVQT